MIELPFPFDDVDLPCVVEVNADVHTASNSIGVRFTRSPFSRRGRVKFVQVEPVRLTIVRRCTVLGFRVTLPDHGVVLCPAAAAVTLDHGVVLCPAAAAVTLDRGDVVIPDSPLSLTVTTDP